MTKPTQANSARHAANRDRIRRYWQRLDALPADASAASIGNAIAEFVHPDLIWHGPAPVGTLHGAEALQSAWLQPLRRAFPDLRIRPYISTAGSYHDEERPAADWVGATGELVGTFAQEWLGIPASGRPVHVRFGEFYRLEDGKIRESYLLLDLLALIHQAGYRLLPESPGDEGRVPGPATGDGVLIAPQDPAVSAASFALVEAMLQGLMSYDGSSLASMGQERFWHPEMRWYGPFGIGTTYRLQGFQDLHQRPFLEAFPDREGGSRDVRYGDGRYVALLGWNSLYATHRGSYLGVPASGRTVAMRVMDFWRTEGGKIAENWVLIDMIDLFRQLGVDLWARLGEQLERQRGE